jgi:hypothetical protein
MAEDVLNSLRSQYEAHSAIAKTAKENMDAIRIAIAAIEASRAVAVSVATKEMDTQSDVATKPKRKRRGEVMRAVLDSLRDGHQTVRDIKEACAQLGLELSGNSISNAISRLQEKGFVRGIPHTDRWEVGRRAAGSELEQALRDSVKAEGSKAVTLKPSESNGTAGVYPVAAVTHTAGA